MGLIPETWSTRYFSALVKFLARIRTPPSQAKNKMKILLANKESEVFGNGVKRKFIPYRADVVKIFDYHEYRSRHRENNEFS